MLKLHVFLVDTGIMFTFDMEMALESVSRLMEAISEVTEISVSKQVLLIANGEPLNPSSRVGSYKSAGTDTNPIFLFSKSAIESAQPPLSKFPVQSEISLEQQVEWCLQMPPTIETIVTRALLASDFHLSARELGEMCENLVVNQQLQQQGWQAVVLNLETITLALSKHATIFQEQYKHFLSTREQYLDMFNRFNDVIVLLSRVPILPCLIPRSESDLEANELCLLDWINSKEYKTALQSLVIQCKELLSQFDQNLLENLMIEVNNVLDSSDNKSMKEIRGLDERLSSLQQRLVLAQQFVQDQADMAQGFKQNQMRAEHIGDTSVLPDLCTSHRKQLLVLLKNHKQLRDICTLCTKAKDELSANLHARLRWVMYVEHSICKCDSKLLVLHESLKKMKRRLEILEQVFEAPRMYVLAVLEILRRKSFSCQFLEWGRSVSLSASEARSEELDKRRKFSQVFGNHFLHSLFAGLDDNPPSFAESPPRIFDELLPDIELNDIRVLQREVPELLVELSLGDSLEQSLYVREKLSQTNLSKLCDPNSNPKLGETLRLRELTGTNMIPKMTVSQLHKEISQEDVVLDLASKQMSWQLGDSALIAINSGEFQPASLKTLPSDHEGNQSSQSSEISDSLFRSAEGLDDRDGGHIENTGEVVGILDLSEEASQRQGEQSSLHFFSAMSKEKPKRNAGMKKGSLNCESINQEILSSDKNINELKSSIGIKIVSKTKEQAVFDTLKRLHACRSSITSLKEEMRDFRFEWKKHTDDNKNKIVFVIEGLVTRIREEEERNKKLELELEDEKELKIKEIENLSNELEERAKIRDLNFNAELQRIKMEREKDLEDLRKEEAEKCQEKLKELTENLEKEMSTDFDLLTSELAKSKKELSRMKEGNNRLGEKVEVLEKELQAKEIECVNEICKVKAEKEEMEKRNAELKNEIRGLKSSKNQLHSENQKNFNSALNQVKKEKENSVRELHVLMEQLKNEIDEKDQLNEKIKVENARYEDFNAKLMERVELFEKDKETLKELYDESQRDLLKIQNDVEKERSNRHNTLEKMSQEAIDNFEKEKFELIEKFEVEKANQKTEFSLERVKLIEDFKKQRSSFKEEMEKEKFEMKQALAKEKDRLTLSFEDEKQRYIQEMEKQQSLSKTSSIEEGIDALEWEKILQNLQDLKVENEALKADKDSEKSSLQNQVEVLKKDFGDIKKECEHMKRKMNEFEVFAQASSKGEEAKRISFRQLKVDDLVILCYDQMRSNYAALSLEETKYFLHPKCKLAPIENPDNPEGTSLVPDWILAYITEQEYCLAKKAQNRFRLPIGTYFYRIHAEPWKKS